MSIIRDLNVLNTEWKYLPIMFSSNVEDVSDYDEYNLLKNKFLSTKYIFESILGRFFGGFDAKVYTFGSDTTNEKKDEVWYFVNGICTNTDVVKMNCEYLNYIFKRPITALHNPTNGFALDILETLVGRDFDVTYEIMNSTQKKISESLKTKKVKVIAHSQGGVIINDIIRYLNNKGVDLSNLEVFTFASPADGANTSKGLYQEHFANEFDWVARVGLMHDDYKTPNLYKRVAAYGHLLNKNYLTAFLKGSYCQKKSRLYSYTEK